MLGASAMGVCNILCLTGDGVQCGDQPEAKPVFDLDSISLLRPSAHARRTAVPVWPQDHVPPQMFLGAADKPLCAALRFPTDPPCQEDRRRRAVLPDAVLLRRADVAAHSCAGPRHGARRALLHPRRRRPPRFGQDGQMDARQCRRASTSPTPSSRGSKALQDQKDEGKRICIDMINEISEIPGVSGVHVMAYRQEEYVSEIVHESGFCAAARRGGATSSPACKPSRVWGRREGGWIAASVMAGLVPATTTSPLGFDPSRGYPRQARA